MTIRTAGTIRVYGRLTYEYTKKRKFGRRIYKLTSPLYVRIGCFEFVIPKGFETDFASVPLPCWPICRPDGKGYKLAAVVHDYMYNEMPWVSRSYADYVFYKLMKVKKVLTWRCNIMWLMVRLFGWTARFPYNLNDIIINIFLLWLFLILIYSFFT